MSSDSDPGHQAQKRARKEKYVSEKLNEQPDESSDNTTDSGDEASCSRTRRSKKARIEDIIAKKVREALNQIQQQEPSSSHSPLISTSSNMIKSDIVPVFDPESGELTSTNWLNKIEQLGRIHNWNDEAKCYYMQSKLSGIAKTWYNGLRDYEKSWEEWKRAVLEAFPAQEHFVDNLKKMLERKKKNNESMMHYYYSKCVLLRKCDISDINAVSCIIDGLPNEFQGTAKSANFKNPEDLFRGYLCKIDGDTSKPTSESKGDIRCRICKKTGHPFQQCFFRKNDCEIGQAGFRQPIAGTSSATFNRTVKECSHCKRKGHTREECFHLNPTKVHLLHRQVNDCYKIDVYINNIFCKGYLDTGSQINVAHSVLLNKFDMKLKPSGIFKGVGTDIMSSKGTCNVEFNFKTFLVKTELHFIDTDLGGTDVIIGQPVLNNKNLTYL